MEQAGNSGRDPNWSEHVRVAVPEPHQGQTQSPHCHMSSHKVHAILHTDVYSHSPRHTPSFTHTQTQPGHTHTLTCTGMQPQTCTVIHKITDTCNLLLLGLGRDPRPWCLFSCIQIGAPHLARQAAFNEPGSSIRALTALCAPCTYTHNHLNIKADTLPGHGMSIHINSHKCS